MIPSSLQRVPKPQHAPKLSLPQVTKLSLDVRAVSLIGLPREFMYPGELDVLVALMRRASPKYVAEIGVNVGRTAKVLLKNVDSIKEYIGFDVLPGYSPSCRVQRNEVPLQPGKLAKDDKRFQLVLRRRGTLDVTVENIRELAPRGLDAVFIDGDHGSAAVQHDTDLALSVLNDRGIIIWHDYHDRDTVGVRSVLDALSLSGVEIYHVEGTWIAFWIKKK